MDVRDTVVGPEVFLALLEEHRQKDWPVSLLIDQEGITRVGGFITDIIRADNLLKTKVLLERGETFLLEQVIAVNGMFRSDYSEC